MLDGDDDPVRPPGPNGWPLVGCLPSYARNPFDFATRVAREYGPLAYYPSLFAEFYQVNDPELVEEVLVRRNEQFVKGDIFQQTLAPVVGEGLLTAEGEQWRRQRHMVNPAFHPDRIREYAAVMVGETERTLDAWRDGASTADDDAASEADPPSGARERVGRSSSSSS